MAILVKEELSVEVMTVTPALAAEWLARKGVDRNLNAARVEMYANSMRAGDWRLNGEAIKFADRRLTDGQHRLAAIVKSGVPIETLVVHGLPEDIHETLDIGKPRTASDLLAMLGHHHTVALAAATAVILRFEQFQRTGRFPVEARLARPDPIKARRVLERCPNLPEWVTMADRLRHVGIPGGDGMWGGTLYWFSTLPAEADNDVRFFIRRLLDGSDMEADDPVLVLRNRLLALPRPVRRYFVIEELMAWIVKAWNAFRRGDRVKQLRWSQGGARREPFPTPI